MKVLDIIKKYQLRANKSFGQNFLFDQNILDRIVGVSGDLSSSYVLEVGMGPCGLTQSILTKNPLGLISLDIDKRFIDIAEKELKPYFNNFEIINADALEIDETKLFNGNFKIISNLPYNIGTTLLFKWLENSINKIEDMVLLLQKEVVDRIVAPKNTKDYGRLSVICQYLCDVKKCFDVAPGLFLPQPKVVSSVVYLKPKRDIDLSIVNSLSYLCRIIFNQRRKTILNNLKTIYSDIVAKNILSDLKIDFNLRPENLEVNDFLKMSYILQNSSNK